MTYVDDNNHRWPSRNPVPGTACIDCNLDYDDILTNDVCRGTIAEPAQSDFSRAWSEFETWALKTFELDMARCKEKAAEYGSADLEIMGQAMQSLIPRSDLDAESRRAAGLEMAIAFYWMGKASRLFGAWNKGTEPGDDSWRDGTIYSLMARYVRDNGRWIG